jgi:hypothetical protein
MQAAALRPGYDRLPYEYSALSDIIRVGMRSSFMHSVAQINTQLTKKLQRNLKYEWKNSRNSTPNSHFALTPQRTVVTKCNTTLTLTV